MPCNEINEVEDYEYLLDRIEEEFKNYDSPFDICLIENIEELHTPFSYEDVIIIRDNRNESFVFENLEEELRNSLLNYTRVYKGDKPFISLKDIIISMINDPHYNNYLIIQDNHQFLEGFEKNSEIQYTACFGS